MDMLLIAGGLGILIGLVMAFTGAGGTILAIPLLMLMLDWRMAEAAPVALLAIVLSSAIATAQGLRAGMVRYRAAALIALLGIVFAPLGVWLTHYISEQWLHVLFVCLLLYVAGLMWRQSKPYDISADEKPVPPCAVNPATSRLFWTARCTKRLIATGASAGFLSGLLGVGGGFVIVPTLSKVTNLPMASITATSLAVTGVISLTSLVAYSNHYTVHMEIAVAFSCAALVSSILGGRFTQRIPDDIIKRTFAVLACMVAVSMLVRISDFVSSSL